MSRRSRSPFLVAVLMTALPPAVWGQAGGFDWQTSPPESQGMSGRKLEALRESLAGRHTAALLVIRNDRIVLEWYAPGRSRAEKHYTASMAKGLAGGLSLAVALHDGLIALDDRAARYIPRWRDDPRKSAITIRHLGSHTSGIEDAEADGLPHEALTGWKGDFWKRLDPPGDPFTISRDLAPALFPAGEKLHYSNPGIALLGHAVTAVLEDGPQRDIRALLRERVFRPIGLEDGDWSVGYGKTFEVDGLPLVATWGGGNFTARAVARIGRLLLRKGDWEGRRILGEDAVRQVTSDAGTPGNCGMGWWSNSEGGLPGLPRDAFWSSGAGHQVVLVVPSLGLIVVRNGGTLDPGVEHERALESFLFAPVIDAITGNSRGEVRPPYPRSKAITRLEWAPREAISRKARGSDNWPLTWADDDALYTAYGDGTGFEPGVSEKLSLGLARVLGPPGDFSGENIRSASVEAGGEGESGRKASGLLMVDGVLYLWARNVGNSQLAWSEDHGATWTWCDWKFTTGFGCPTFLNFGRNYQGARDGHVYVYSHDSDSAYRPADRMVLARVPKCEVRRREAYEFFMGLDSAGAAWTPDIARRGPVFSHPGRCYRSGITFNAGLKRYLWCQTLPGGDARFAGGFGIYDAPEPWGPWTTVFHTEEWDVGPGETQSFPSKWMSEDGTRLHLVSSGDDAFSVRGARLSRGDGGSPPPGEPERLRVIIETDAGGDPDDEQSLVRFLLYSSEWDVEGIIANRPIARDGENLNPERTGLGVVRALLKAYGACHPTLVRHDPRFPDPAELARRAVAGYDDTGDGVSLIIAAVDAPDPRPVWFTNWGTDNGAARSCLRRALDRVLAQRGQEAYARFKEKLRLSSDDQFGEHTGALSPPFPLWVDTFRPPVEGKRWYHRFSALTATAGGFDLERDARTGHGPLGALYPTNTTHRQKEGDTMAFLYLVPNGLNEPAEPAWGGWAGRYGLRETFPGKPYYWANQVDGWEGTTHRDNVLKRWAVHLQNDFKARMDWCVKPLRDANHPPRVLLNGISGRDALRLDAAPGAELRLDASASSDPDGDKLAHEWVVYPEAGTYRGDVTLEGATSPAATVRMPPDCAGKQVHVVLAVTDSGEPQLTRYRRAVITGKPAPGLRAPLHRTVDLSLGESREIELPGVGKTAVKLLEIVETREAICSAVWLSRVKVAIGGEEVWLTAGTYNLPVTAGQVQVDCPITRGPYGNCATDYWALEKDARLRLWPRGSPLLEPGTFVYPLRQRWFAGDTWMSNEPVIVDAPKGKLYYHAGLDIGGSEGLIDVLSATDGLVVVGGEEALPGHPEGSIPGYARERYRDQVFVLDDRGWYHGYVHLKTIDVRAGQVVKKGEKIGLLGKEGGSGGWSHLHYEIRSRQPSGRWGTENGYPFIREAYVREQRPPLIAVAGPIHHQLAEVGRPVTLDGSLSSSLAGPIVKHEWAFSGGGTASGPTATRTYEKPGTYSEVLRVVDSMGNMDLDFALIQAVNLEDTGEPGELPPRLNANYAPTLGIRQGDPVTFKVRTWNTREGSETWDFGDGTPPATTKSDNDYAETVHRFEKPGHYLVRVERTGLGGAKGVTHLQVRVERSR